MYDTIVIVAIFGFGFFLSSKSSMVFSSNKIDIDKLLEDYEKIQKGLKKIHKSLDSPDIVPPKVDCK